jgi:soluble P-type ATPase
VSENRNEEDTDKAEELMKRFVIRELKKRKIILVRVKRE